VTAKRWHGAAAGAVAANAAALGACLVFPEGIVDFFEWTASLGVVGPLVVTAAFVPATLLFLPPALLALGAGFAFGLLRGFAITVVGKTLGGAAAFTIGRTVARRRVRRMIDRRPRLRAVDRAVEREGFKIVALSRLSPLVPFGAINYTFGATKIPFSRYLAATFIGGILPSLLYVYLGTIARSLTGAVTGASETGPGAWALYGGGLAATVALTWVVARVARHALEEPPGAPA
jgi:uncharacterized membrane protein YdjX (TVP38/TMEM64 family)